MQRGEQTFPRFGFSKSRTLAGKPQLAVIYGGTLTPAEGTPIPFYAPYDEAKRVAINQFIRESGTFDAVVDFAAAVSDPARPSRWKAGLSADLLHPSDAGAEVLADAIDLATFQ